MKLILTTIKDELTGFQNVIGERSEETAIRSFCQAINNPEAIMYANREDFSLWKLGEYDSDTGVIVPELKLLKTGYSVVKEVKDDEIPN